MEKTRSEVAILVFVLGVILLGWAWWNTLEHLFNILWTVDSFSHGLLIPFISLGLIWTKRDMSLTLSLKGDWRGLILATLAAMLWALAVVADFKIFEHMALILGIQAIAVACFGLCFFRRNLFAFLFLFLAVPVGDSFIPVLQTVTAELVLFMLSLLKVPYDSEGVLITLSSGVFEVARACAGIKFLFTSLVMGILLAHIAYRSWRRRLAIILLSASLPIVANALRVLGILLISELTDPDFAKGVDHIVYGWGFLSVILLILIALAYKFSDVDKEPPRDEIDKEAKPVSRSSTPSLFTLSLLIALPFMVARLQANGQNVSYTNPTITAPTCDGCDFRLLDTSRTGMFSTWLGADDKFEFHYRSAADVIAVSGALYCAQRPERKLLQSGNRLAGDDWSILPGLEEHILQVGAWMLKKQTFWRNSARQTVYYGYFINEKFVFAPDTVKLEIALKRLKFETAKGAVFTISIPHSSGAGGTDNKIEKFLSTFPLESFLWPGMATNSKGAKVCAV